MDSAKWQLDASFGGVCNTDLGLRRRGPVTHVENKIHDLGSRASVSPFFSENETEENEKKERKRKKSEPAKKKETAKKERNGNGHVENKIHYLGSRASVSPFVSFLENETEEKHHHQQDVRRRLRMRSPLLPLFPLSGSHALTMSYAFLTYGLLTSGKNKTLQMVTLQVKIELFFFLCLGNFGARGKQEHGRELRADFLWLFARVQFSLAVLPFEVF